MKIRPVILCGGSGTRLWPNLKKHQAKQFIDFGGWTLIGQTLRRVKKSIFDTPIISTNLRYLKDVNKHLKENKINKYKIILEPAKKNTGPAILSSALLKGIPEKQPMVFLSADHLIENVSKFNKEIKKNIKFLNAKNIFVFGVKPTAPSENYGYFLSKKNKLGFNQVLKFIEKPNKLKAKLIIKKSGYWNSGMFFARKESIIHNFKKYQKNTFRHSFSAVKKAKLKNNVYFLHKREFLKNSSKSFDYAILEKMKHINAINLNISWSDLGSWKEILLMYKKNLRKYYNKKNTYYRPWGKYTNLFKGKNFLIKEIVIKPRGILSLQKHFHRSEQWLVTKGKPLITLNKKRFIRNPNDTISIPKGAVHRIENPNKKQVKIMEAQLGFVLKESDIVRYQDIYGRAN